MARLRNIARDVVTGAPIVVGDAEIDGPDGTLLDSITVDGATGVWDYQANGSPGRTVQTFAGGGQTKVVDGHTHGQAGFNYEGELDRILGLFGDGVIDGMAVTAPGGMAVAVGTGDLLNLGVLHPIYAAENVAIGAADPTNPRIDRVVSRLTRTGTFAGRLLLAVVAGTPAASPAAPALTQDATTWEVEVCRVTVPAAAAAIVLGNISVATRPVATGPLADGSVTQAKLAKPSVGTPELFDGAVTLAKVADGVLVPGLLPGFIATYWYGAKSVVGGENAAFSVAQNTLYASPVYVPKAATLTGIGVSRTSGTSVSATGRLGLYAAGAGGLPGAIAHDAGTINLSTNGVKTVTGLSVAIAAGWYWATVCAGSFSGTVFLSGLATAVGTGEDIVRHLFGEPAIGPSTEPLWSPQGVFAGVGALPATFPAPGVSAAGPNVWIQTAGT